MTRVRARGEDIRRYIIDNIEKHANDISRVTAEKFAITRQAVNKHLHRLTKEKALTETGKTRNRSYKLAPLLHWERSYARPAGLAEDVIWRNDVLPILGQMPDNVIDIWHYGFTEMFNNAIDHSSGERIGVEIRKTAATTEMMIYDDGVGIFRKIREALNLMDDRHAILELSKGKLTTDPARHTGEGIFFSSRMFDSFDILSQGVFFSHQFGDDSDWILERELQTSGTAVWMKLFNHTARTTQKIFDAYSVGDDFGFNKTVVPVMLARYGEEQLVSRSQAKRLLSRVEVFKEVIFDFSGVNSIGQAFADEIFRVFKNSHPEIALYSIHANSAVKRMIERVKGVVTTQPESTSS
jgi:hypothetical protein